MRKKGFLIIFFIFTCEILYACNRTQSAQDVYKEAIGQKETDIQQEKTQDMQKNSEDEEIEEAWAHISTNYISENESEMNISYKYEWKEDLKVRVLDAFYSDSVEAGGEYFKISENFHQSIERTSDIADEKKKYLFMKVEVENISKEPASYSVRKITPHVCKIDENTMDVSNIMVDTEMAFDGTEDIDGGWDYYFIYLQPGEIRTFTAGFIVYKDLLIENIENVYISASMGFLQFDKGDNYVTGDFKLLHIPVREVQNGGENDTSDKV